MPEDISPPKVKFYQNHRPMMDSGEYTLTISGSISHTQTGNKHDGITTNNTATATLHFAVYGERYTLNDHDIHAVFPAAGRTGEYSSILPHIIFNRNTLPWERHADPSNKDLPWMALLLFDEEETPVKKIISVKDLGINASGESFFPNLDQEVVAQHSKDKLTVIDLSKTLLKKILPTAESLLLLAHTRQGVDNNDQQMGDENAVVFCNRLPAQGQRSTLHLVSLEGRYKASGFDYPDGKDLFRLVSLKSWEFYTTEHFKITSETLTALQGKAPTTDLEKISTLLDREFAGTEALFVQAVQDDTGVDVASFKETLITNAKFDKTFDGLLLGLNKDILTLRLPADTDPGVEHFLAQGLTPLVHHFRNGDQSVSWYRGPFLPYQPDVTVNGSAIRNIRPKSADELLQFYQEQGMFDVSYSAAWEVGRLLALSSKDFSVSVFQWKRLIAQHHHKASQLVGNEHLPIFAHSHNHEQEAHLWERHLQPWLDKLASFQSTPANYLLPQEGLLPKESIRFFCVDKNWQTALLIGAFSIGGDWDAESQADDNAFNNFLKLENTYSMGFLLRSDVVDGWPGLLIDGLDVAGNKLAPLRRQLSRDILLCLFKANVTQVIFHQKPEVMHFGLSKQNNFSKQVRDMDGVEEKDKAKAKQVIWQSNNQNSRVIDIARLADDLGKRNNPAQFAMNMIEGVPKVIFNLTF